MPAESEHAEVLVPAPFLVAGFMLASILLHLALPLPAPAPGLVRPLGLVFVVGGLLLAGLAALRMRRAHTPVSPHRPSTALVTDGPYGFTRNPIYLGFFLIFLGFTFIAGTLWGMVLAPVLPLTVDRLIISAEETYLQDRFQGDYTQYRSRVRKWL
jgi:protein-S-isoprenylcysteine O-methyltransferase Ste14